MTSLRRLLWLVPAAMVAMAIAAAPAGALPVEIKKPTAGNPHCGAVSVSNHLVSGDCKLQAALIEGGTTGLEVRGHLFGVEMHGIECAMTFDIYIDENGSGYIFNIGISGGGGCGGAALKPCEEGANLQKPWSFNSEENGLGDLTHGVDVCLDGTYGCAGITGAFLSPVAGGGREYAFVDARVGSSPCEIQGHWTVTGDNVMIVHL